MHCFQILLDPNVPERRRLTTQDVLFLPFHLTGSSVHFSCFVLSCWLHMLRKGGAPAIILCFVVQVQHPLKGVSHVVTCTLFGRVRTGRTAACAVPVGAKTTFLGCLCYSGKAMADEESPTCQPFPMVRGGAWVLHCSSVQMQFICSLGRSGFESRAGGRGKDVFAFPSLGGISLLVKIVV